MIHLQFQNFEFWTNISEKLNLQSKGHSSQGIQLEWSRLIRRGRYTWEMMPGALIATHLYFLMIWPLVTGCTSCTPAVRGMGA